MELSHFGTARPLGRAPSSFRRARRKIQEEPFVMPISRPSACGTRTHGPSAILVSLVFVLVLAASAQAGPPSPVPYVNIVSPASITPGSTGVTLTVHGTGYVSGSSTVYWNGVALTTTFVSAKLLTAAVPNGLVAAQGVGSVTVVTTAPGGGASNITY